MGAKEKAVLGDLDRVGDHADADDLTEVAVARLGQDPEPGTIYKDVLDMRAARRVWEGFQTTVGVASEEARKYGTFPPG